MKINFRRPDGENEVIDMSYVPREGEGMRLGDIGADVYFVKSVIHQPKDRLWKAMITLSYFPDK